MTIQKKKKMKNMGHLVVQNKHDVYIFLIDIPTSKPFYFDTNKLNT